MPEPHLLPPCGLALLPLCSLLLVAFTQPEPAQDAVEAQRGDADRPSIVLVTIDTLRREHLGCYGYPRPTSPRVDALAAESVLFENVLAPMATTFPSHLSVLTGLYPHQHGGTSNRGALRRPFSPAPGRVSAAGALGSVGYRTAGFVSVVVLHERTGIGAGFETYDGPPIGIGKRTARETMDKALAWLASVPAEEPCFLWVHLFDVHEPNTPEPEFAALLAPDDELRAFVARRGLDPAELTRRFASNRGIGERFFALPPPKAERQPPGMRTPGLPSRSASKQAAFRIDTEALVRLHARYDACVRQVDHEVGRLIDALVQRGSWARTAFVFTADHGQSLGDGAHLGHGKSTQVNVSIPLVIHFPTGEVSEPARTGAVPQPARIGALVSLVDLMPTLLAALPIAGLETYRAQFSGRDVLSAGFARAGVFTAETTELHRAKKRPYGCAIVTGRWKYARSEGSPGRLYDLAGAGEAVDVSAEHADVARELDLLLSAELASSILVPEDSEPLDPDGQALLDQLEELGYGGGDEDE